MHTQPKVDTLFAVAFKGGEQLEPVRAELYNDRLVIYRHDLVYEDVLAHNVSMPFVPTEPSPAFHSIQCVIWSCRKLGSDSQTKPKPKKENIYAYTQCIVK